MRKNLSDQIQIHKKHCGHYPIVSTLTGDNLFSGKTEIDVCKDCKEIECFLDFKEKL